MEGDREHLLAEGSGYSPGTRWHPTGLPAVMSARVCNADHQIRNLRPEKWSSMVVVRCGNPEPRMSAQDHLHALPRRSIAVRFIPVSGIDSRSQALPSRAKALCKPCHSIRMTLLYLTTVGAPYFIRAGMGQDFKNGPPLTFF
jgi:hypothetical protein